LLETSHNLADGQVVLPKLYSISPAFFFLFLCP
jgi:hypothetical protein